MLRDLITWVLNTYLGKYLENLNSAQLSVALLSGEVELENVPIRKDALRFYGLPIEVVSGSIGKIKLHVPVRQFRSSPWRISLEGLYCVICPKDLDSWDDAKEKALDLEYKLAILDSAESKWRSEKGQQTESYYFSSYNNWLKYGTNMATNIIDNIELKISDVHFRYEDIIELGGTKIAAGIKIGSLTAQSCDSNWDTGVNRTVNNDMNYKIVELTELSFYWDNLHDDIKCQHFSNQQLSTNMNSTCELRPHNFIIKPIGATARWKREKCQQVILTKDRPRVSCAISVPEVIIVLSNVQHGQILKKLVGIRDMKEMRTFKLTRPTISVKDNPKLWWKYVLVCHGFVFKRKEEKMQTLRENVRYIKLYQRLMLNPNENLSKEDQSFKSNIEYERNVSELMNLRRVCFENAFTMGLALKSQNLRGKGMLFHWFPNWMGWYGNSSVQNAEQDESLKNLEDDILIELEHSLENSPDIKRDAIFGLITIELLNGLVILQAESSSTNEIMSMEIQFNKLSSFLELNPLFTSYAMGISLGEIYLLDKTSKATKHPYLIKPQTDNIILLKQSEIKNNTKNASDEEPLFQLRYENDNQLKFGLSIKSKSLDITYNKDAVAWIVKFFTKSHTFTRFGKKNMETPNGNNLLMNWNHFVIGSEANRKTWSFEVEVFAPRIIFLENYTINNPLMILMDFGKFEMMKSDFTRKPAKNKSIDECELDDKSDDEEAYMTPCSTPPGSEKSASESPTLYDNLVEGVPIINKDSQLESALYSKIYDKYKITFADLQVLVCKYQEGWQASLKSSSNFHLVDKFNITITLEQRTVFTSDPEYPALIVYGTLPTILIHGNEENINHFCNIMYPIAKNRGLGERTNSVEKTVPRTEERLWIDSNLNENQIIIQFSIAQMIIEMQSKEKSIAELQIIGARARLTKTAGETNITMSVHGLLLVDAIQTFGPDFELLVASHRHVGMDSFSGSLRHSTACSPVTPGSPDPTAYQKPANPYIINNAVWNIQKGGTPGFFEDEDTNALISVEIKIVAPTNDSVSFKKTNIAFNNLDIIANQDTILELMDFIKRTILNQKIFESFDHRDEVSPPKESEDSFDHSHIEIAFDFFRLNILILYTINREKCKIARKVGTLTMSEAKIYASIQSEVSVSGSLGGIQIIDITPEGICHQRILSHGRDPVATAPETNRLSIFDELSNEIYFNNFDEQKYQQMNALNFKIQWSNRVFSIHIRMASVWYTHCPRFLQDLNVCVTHFKRSLKQFFTSIGSKASDMAKEIVQQIKEVNYLSNPTQSNVRDTKNSHLSLNVIINSPVIVLPISNESTEVLVANLGEISCSNGSQSNISNICDNFVETYVVDVRNINLFSLNIVERNEDTPTLPKAKELYSYKNEAVSILHDTAISLTLSKGFNEASSDDKQLHNFSIEGSMVETLKVSLYRRQYEQLLSSIKNATNFSSMTTGAQFLPDSTNTTLKSSFVEEDSASTITIQFSVPVFEINLQNEYCETLISVIFKDFNVNQRINGHEKHLEVTLKSVLMEDLKSQMTSPFRSMVTSINLEKGVRQREQPSSSCPDLPTLCCKHKNMSISMPSSLNESNKFHNFERELQSGFCKKIKLGDRANENLVIYKSHTGCASNNKNKLEELSSIEFNCLNLAICVDRWFTIFEFFGLVSQSGQNQDSLNQRQVSSENIYDISSKLKVSIRSLNFTLIRNETQLSRVNVSNAIFIIIKETTLKTIEGCLGSVTVYDLTKFGIIYKERFLTSGSEAFNFVYKKKLSQLHTLNPLSANAVLRINMSSVHYIHTKRFIVELQLFVKELLQLQTPVIYQLKKHNSDKEQNLQPTKIKLLIQADSPVIMLPASYNSNHLLIADLGQFTLKNSFHFASEECVISKKPEVTKEEEILDVMYIDLNNINLFSGERCIERDETDCKKCDNWLSIANMNIVKHGRNLFKQSCFLKLQLERNLSTHIDRVCPDISVKGTFSKLNGILDPHQYKLIRGLLGNNLGEPIDDVYYNYQSNLCQSIEKLSALNLFTKNENSSVVWNTLSITILLEDVSILLVLSASLNLKPLACIHFIKSSLEIDMFSDGSQDIDLISSNILIVDERISTDGSNLNVFKNILRPSMKETLPNNTVQAEIHCRKRLSSCKYTIMLNNMRLMAVLSFWEKLKSYFEEEPLAVNTFNAPDQINHKSITKSENNPIVEFVVNITDSEIIFLEQYNHIGSNAIILKSTTVISYKPNSISVPLSIDINHLEIFSCSLDAEDESALSIIDPFTLNIELRNNCLCIFIQKQLNVRLSYIDMKVFLRMLRTIPSQTSQKQNILPKTGKDFEKIAPLLAMGFEITECWTAMELNNWKLNESALWLSQQKHNINQHAPLELKTAVLDANLISIYVIDDCMDADVPLLELSFSKVLLKHKFKAKRIDNESSITSYFTEGDIETELSINYYNRLLSGWEPLSELWECTGKWKVTKTYTDKKNRFEISINSKQLLKLNITTTLIELFQMVSKNWANDFSKWTLFDNENKNSTFKQRSPFIPFALENLTGTPLLFKPVYAQLGDLACSDTQQKEITKNWISVEPNEIKNFDFSHKNKLRHVDSHQLNLHQILVQIHGWTLIGPISIDKVGIFFRSANFDSYFAKKTRIIFDISLVGSAQKLIKVKTAVSIINKLDRDVTLKMILSNEQNDNIVATSVIKAYDQQCISLKFIDASLYIKHNSNSSNNDNAAAFRTAGKDNEDFGYSNHEISWKQCVKDYVQSLQTCYDVNKCFLYTLININRDIFPHKEPNLPGHTITLLPPLKLNNMLCCDLIFEINGSMNGRINASQSVSVYNVNICESFNLSITLDNFQLSGQLKVPMNHIGIVEPKLKLIDIHNRELYLRISIQSFHGKGMEIYISAPIWIINKTGLPLIYKQEGLNYSAPGQFEEHETARQISPLMFSFSDQEGSAALEVRLGNAYGSHNLWCKSFSIHKNLTHRELRAQHTKGCYAIGISIRRGRGLYLRTTFVTLSPRFQLHNNSGYRLEFAQKCDIDRESLSMDKIILAPIDCNFPFHWPNWDREPLICVRIADTEFCCWSKAIPINEVQSVYINIRNEWGEMFFLRLEVISKGATYILLFTDARTLPPPIRIDNCSEVVITFSQMDSKPSWPTPVRPQSSLSYAMDDPLGKQMLILEAPGGNTIDFPVNKLNITRTLTYTNFIYIAFHKTFNHFNMNDKSDAAFQQLVLGVRDKKVVIMEKNSGNRSQLWLMNSSGQLEHEGSSPPIQTYETNAGRLVLDLEKPPNPTEYTALVVRPPNKQRITTQTWRFENGRLMCHANMCVQAPIGEDGLRPNAEAVLGRIESAEPIPVGQYIVAQKLRPGSGQLEVSTKMDGPICSVQICDIKLQINEIFLAPDLLWTHASLNNRQAVDEDSNQSVNEYLVCVELPKGIGISIITRKPCEEIMYISLENISANLIQNVLEKSLDLNVLYIQIDNQLLDANCPVLLHSSKLRENEKENAIVFKLKLLPSPNKSAIIFKYLTLDMKPCVAYLEERVVLKMACFLSYGKIDPQSSSSNFLCEFKDFEERLTLKDMKRYYFENFSIGSTQVRLSALSASKLPAELQETKRVLGLTLIKFEDALIELDKFSDKYHFETMDVYLRAIKIHYINQIKWHAASILGSVDFLGNPLGFANDLSEGVSGLIFEGSVKSLVKNVTHGISNSTAKLTETLSDSLGRVVLDDHDNETRQRMLELQSNTSSGHLAAGLKGFGFGLLGGVTSIVRHTYDGAQADGVPGFLSGLGKGLVGTVTKPIIGMLDLASETASAVRETSRGAHRYSPDRKRLPRCVTGALGDLLPSYSSRQSKGQQYLYIINRRNFAEKIISYDPNLWSDSAARLRLLVSTEYVRVFSLCDGNPTIMFECHLSEILSCHPLVTNTGSAPSSSKLSAHYYIEISTNLPKVTRPRIRCRAEDIAETASRCINYAKSVFDEREHSFSLT